MVHPQQARRRAVSWQRAPMTMTRRWDGQRWDGQAAEGLLRELLIESPERLAHSLTAGRQARRVAATVAAADVQLLISAALLHDIGYAGSLARTGFHPVDGAAFLLRIGAPVRLAALVAHHSEAQLLAPVAGAAAELAAFANEDSAVTDALIFADMTAGPAGEPMSIHDRLADIQLRHAEDDPRLLAARLARVPLLLTATRRVEARLGMAAGRPVSNRDHRRPG